MTDSQDLESPVANDQPTMPSDHMGFIELLFGVLFTPRAVFRRISQNPPLLYGFVVFLAVVFFTSVVNTLIPPELANTSPGFAAAMTRTRPYIGIIGALFSFITWFILAGTFQLLAELFGGKGRAIGVLTVLALAELPKVLVIPFQVISYFSANTFFGRFLTIAASLVAFIWWAIILVIGLKEIQHFSTGRAVATLLIPLGVVLLAAVIFTVAIVGLMIPFMGSAFQNLQ